MASSNPSDNLAGNLFLIGFMGAGKTTIGRTVAHLLGRPFFDTDHEIEARCGVRIATIFELEGEEGFRRRETRVLDDLTQRSGIVLATGGGAVLRAENRDMLRTRGHVVYLDATVQELWRRTRRNRNRPLLQVENPRARLESMFMERDPLYRETAHVIMPAHSGSVAQAAASVLAQLGFVDCGTAHDAAPSD
ncbi:MULTISPECIES: shikimate kinase [unclassified Cupriavidus]|uniref:shikimate kinase n=1 Tax=unclassified Cupriavidus TaxID=2640874 RepID=UPI001F2FC848|nr:MULTISPECIES: shikimate kinase [unclassified Cupriavidus]